MEDRDEMLRRWIKGSHGFRSGGFVAFEGVPVLIGATTTGSSTPSKPAKDWSKIETYWPHLAARNAAPQPRRGI